MAILLCYGKPLFPLKWRHKLRKIVKLDYYLKQTEEGLILLYLSFLSFLILAIENSDTPLLVSKNQIKAIKALVFKVTKEIYNVKHLDTNFDAYAVDLSMVLTWAIRAQQLHGSDQEDMEFNIKIDGCPLGSELNVSFLQSMQQLLPPLIYGSKLSIRCRYWRIM